ncbi:DNA-binding protein [Bifidobacterium reuteri]|uniref:DNA-binding protein n=1 Tax=Bifidobacterium reuteri TaxID=983706 RepID=A0A5J5E7S4_9BIFI|nr:MULTISPECIES: recombinase RecT [Bifidobacterium]KAA8825141.1 DNA-binding protein [Bifidobacterium reuteri]TPF78383.1 hypothetical protein BW09_04840 [Bifidobacterium sp. UTCIF-1]TPF81197.1 hypothetical protein BW08_00740 [Bifidobacterium sp. UTCIF-24]TPF81977.1 hypothetical protein BW12_06905 [Bifidobacterium sp. UTCIF-3]TPF85175.1 hypothetical protein BW07_00445 [Bifidobacterium sp. UTCIF-36]
MGQLARSIQNRQLQAMPNDQERKQQFMTALEKAWPRIVASMPKHMTPDRIFQMYQSTLSREPKLRECTLNSVLSCFMKCAQLGLELSNADGLGKAYIIPFFNNKNNEMEATFLIGYRGMLQLARNSGEIKSMQAKAVYDGDEFHYQFGLHEDLVHIPAEKRPRNAKLTHVYFIALFKDGGHQLDVMTRDEVDAVRSRSKSKNNGPWVTDYEAMAIKSVIRRAFKMLPNSADVKEEVQQHVDAYTPDYSGILPSSPEGLPDSDADAPEEPSDIDGVLADGGTEQPAEEPDPVEVKRRDVIRRFQQLGVTSDAEACGTISKVLGREVKETGGLPEADLDVVLAQLKASVREGE